MSKKNIKRNIIIISVLVFVTCATIGGFILMSEYNYRFGEAVVKDGNIKVYPGMNIKHIARELAQEGIIADSNQMLSYAKRHQIDSVRVGNYDFSKGDSYRTLLGNVSYGRQTPIQLTFNNFRTVERLAGAVARRTLADSADFVATLYNDSLLNARGFKRETIISMFIPNTYEVYWTITPQEFFERMYSEYDNFWSSRRRARAERLGFTQAQIATIASIVDSETNKTDEMSNVAGVYINRLRKGMPLQADPTVKFALGNFSLRRILNRHLQVDSPYNTYKNSGLPPGPICMSSIAAIDATLNYEGHEYLYFCARADFSGYHVFAKTLSEHNKNAREYQRELNRRNIK